MRESICYANKLTLISVIEIPEMNTTKSTSNMNHFRFGTLESNETNYRTTLEIEESFWI